MNERMHLRILICQRLVASDYPDLDVTLAAQYPQELRAWVARTVNETRAQIMSSR